jgi:hypothetical protein
MWRLVLGLGKSWSTPALGGINVIVDVKRGKNGFFLSLFLLLPGCGQKQDVGWLGYGEGDDTVIAAPQPGWMTEMKVERGTMVHRGDQLLILDDTQRQASRDQARRAVPGQGIDGAGTIQPCLFANRVEPPERIGEEQCRHSHYT